MSDKKEPAKGAEKKKPPIIIIASVIAVVAILGGFVVGKQVSAKSKDGAAVKKVEPGPVMPLDEFLVNLADPGGDHFLKVTVNLELDKDKGKTPESLKEQVAPIRDAVLTALCSKTRDEITPLAGRDKLKAEIKKNVNAALGESDVSGVYFINFVTQ
ncbi:MAG: flagellar basal body-associated FliL family protein [Armatimonadetes bacterium]|nr:flagellar basal body-associated FliL family protein [Armatimonadota bacterium]